MTQDTAQWLAGVRERFSRKDERVGYGTWQQSAHLDIPRLLDTLEAAQARVQALEAALRQALTSLEHQRRIDQRPEDFAAMAAARAVLERQP